MLFFDNFEIFQNHIFPKLVSRREYISFVPQVDFLVNFEFVLSLKKSIKFKKFLESPLRHKIFLGISCGVLFELLLKFYAKS